MVLGNQFVKPLTAVYRLIPIIASLLVLFGSYASASQITVNGYVFGTWDTDTVLVVGDIRIPPDNDLAIQPGVKVLFDGPWQFQVQQDARIVAVGTPTQKITFKPLHYGDTWRGMRMELCCGLSILDYCDFYHAVRAGIGDTASGGAIGLRQSSLAIYHCLFDSCSAANGGAIACIDNSNPLITDGIFGFNRANSGGGIYVADSSRPLILSCDFFKSRAELGGGAIHSSNSSPTISQNQFMYNWGEDGCIRIWGPDTTMLIENNIFYYDSSRSVIHISDMGPWSAIIRNNLINDNDGVAVFAEVASPRIERNIITGNGDGLDLWYSASTVSCNRISDNKGSAVNVYSDNLTIPASPTIEHNIIDRNLGGGIAVEGGNPIIRDNYITRNRARWYGGIRLDFCAATLSHNTIAGNISDSVVGGIISLDGTTNLSHCIVFGNLPESTQVLTNYSSWGVTADSCDIQGGWVYGTGNIDIDPLFRDTARGKFFATSDAITTKPLASCGNGIPDSMEIWINPNATGIDDNPLVNMPREFTLAQNFPNPFNPNTTISFSLPYRTHVRLEIYNTLGRLVRTLCDRIISAGETQIEWDSRDSRGQVV
ncbi:hypothetical protein C3F09_12020, partial [candidate division GN15 bacterium]